MAYNRKVSVSIGLPGAQGFLFTERNRISFDVFKTKENSPNKATVQIYNLSQPTRTLLKNLNFVCTIAAGYEDQGLPKNIFFGNINSIGTEYKRPDVITQIEAIDGSLTVRQKAVTFSFIAGTPIANVLSAITAILAIPVRQIAPLPPLQYINGFSFVGLAIDALDKVLRYAELKWTIQNGELYIYRESLPSENLGFLISPATGLIDSPKPLQDLKDEANPITAKQRYEIKTILFPGINVLSFISLQSKNVGGIFQVNNVRYKGDSFEGDFVNEMEIIEV